MKKNKQFSLRGASAQKLPDEEKKDTMMFAPAMEGYLLQNGEDSPVGMASMNGNGSAGTMGSMQNNGTFHGELPKEEAPLSVEERLAKLEALFAKAQLSPMAEEYVANLRNREAEQKKASHEALLAKLKAQEQEARQLYPKLSLVEEAKDPRFVELLKCGLDVRSAFEIIHKDEIIAASMEYAAREMERMMSNKILAAGLRPMENGGNHGPALTKVDVKAMSRQDRKDMIRRVQAGEKIVL